ncbi:TPA: hypothetical protein N0F65_009026 [Lagenidium giganteum]|uniref:Uncharacterized protein n=1 Tax=Lagenidium giganteum TaxID=4803 RepID=A0AAV2YWS3_9STRA|nr:TPA: hypothetical protein N0F65_009026 [Lagenidium giganteum]
MALLSPRRRDPKDSYAAYARVHTPNDKTIDEIAESPVATTPANLVPILDLFRYADRTDKLLMTAGAIAALVAGLSQPIQIVLIGDVMNAFNPADLPRTIRDNVNHAARNFVFVGIAVIVFCFIQVACWSITASRQAKRIRSAYVSAILTKEIGWFDLNEPMELCTRVADSTVTIQEGIGRKVGDGLHFFSMSFSGIVIGLIKGWQLTLVLLAFTPFIAVTAYIAMKVLSTATQSGIESYGQAGAIAQEALGNVRTVHMFNAVQYFVDKYDRALEATTKAGIKKGIAVGWGTGLMFFTVYCTYACGLFYGAVRISNDQLSGEKCTGSNCYDGGKVMTVFFAVIMGAMALGQAAPSVQAIYAARTSAHNLRNVTFAYPSRPHINVCSRYSLTIEAGETVALVGPSGSGKSTIVSLLERFYDPQEGAVKLDGHDIKDLNVKWLRQQVGLVGQEPSLFATSIMENIRYGCPSASDEEVRQAAKMANAYNFIMEFPQGFDTEVGERGTQLSGGQKQRIAIARAIIKNPPVLLLDEATSALDTESERVVQESLDSLLATSKRTTIIIAHRLSTIRNASRIAVHEGGRIVEIGAHEQLMALPNGRYRQLVQAQCATSDQEVADCGADVVATTDAPQAPLTRSVSVSSSHSSVRSAKNPAESVREGADDNLTSDELVPLSRIWKMTQPEWKFLTLGGLGAVVNAAVFPVWGVLLTKIIMLFFDYGKDKYQMRTDARHWSLGFLGLGVVFGGSIIVQHYGFAVASQRLVSRVRLQTFRAMLRQEIGWFDMDENSSGALVARLATDSATLQAMTSETLNQGLVNITTLGIGFAIAFYCCW